jgi:hypothetical protein
MTLQFVKYDFKKESILGQFFGLIFQFDLYAGRLTREYIRYFFNSLMVSYQKKDYKLNLEI